MAKEAWQVSVKTVRDETPEFASNSPKVGVGSTVVLKDRQLFVEVTDIGPKTYSVVVDGTARKEDASTAYTLHYGNIYNYGDSDYRLRGDYLFTGSMYMQIAGGEFTIAGQAHSRTQISTFSHLRNRVSLALVSMTGKF
ncbi:MAG TPA: hypothetical protein VLE91_00045 [Candidatus Saccharimonadales bacterium]|nr:hypothetical protein [Candidatus Saccharimonadales bacterium]